MSYMVNGCHCYKQPLSHLVEVQEVGLRYEADEGVAGEGDGSVHEGVQHREQRLRPAQLGGLCVELLAHQQGVHHRVHRLGTGKQW